MEINTTYLWYGERQARASNALRQQRQDEAAERDGQSSGRGGAKANYNYNNARYDLVDATNATPGIIEQLDNDSLPDNMQSMNLEEKKAHLAEMTDRRAEIQDQLRQLTNDRATFLAQNEAGTNAESFGTGIQEMIRDQMSQAGFEMKN